MRNINKFIEKLNSYQVSSHKVWDLKDKVSVLKMDWNESTITPSIKVKSALIDFINSNPLNWYPDLNNQKLNFLLSKYTSLPQENIQYFGGSDSLHEYIVKTFLNPGEKILIVGPTYDHFRAVVESLGGLVEYHYLSESSNYAFFVNELNNKIKLGNYKIVYVCNPNNPTGTIILPDEIQLLLNENPETLFLIDEAYHEFNREYTASAFVRKFNNIIISRTFSKAFGLAGFRVGYALSSTENISYLTKVRNPKNITALSQVAAIAALSDLEYINHYIEEVRLSKNILIDNYKKFLVRGLKFLNLDMGGNFVLIHCETKEIKTDVLRMFESHNMFLRDFSWNKQLENCIRMTIGTQEQTKKVLGFLVDE